MRTLKESKCYFNKVCIYKTHLGLMPSLVIRMFLPSQYKESIFHMGDLSPTFKKKREGQSILLVPAVFQVSLHQNNPYCIYHSYWLWKVSSFQVSSWDFCRPYKVWSEGSVPKVDILLLLLFFFYPKLCPGIVFSIAFQRFSIKLKNNMKISI